jgi:hypothetical protein
MINFGRLIAGMGAWGGVNVAIVYVQELAPSGYRGGQEAFASLIFAQHSGQSSASEVRWPTAALPQAEVAQSGPPSTPPTLPRDGCKSVSRP